MLVVPDSQHKPIYYFSLITELCKLSPSTIGPAVGKSIRKLYTFLGDGLDVEIAQRFSEWFAIHMSNFNFQWVWKEWFVVLLLVSAHSCLRPPGTQGCQISHCRAVTQSEILFAGHFDMKFDCRTMIGS